MRAALDNWMLRRLVCAMPRRLFADLHRSIWLLPTSSWTRYDSNTGCPALAPLSILGVGRMSGHRDVLSSTRTFLEARFGDLEVRESSFPHLGADAFQANNFSARGARADFSSESSPLLIGGNVLARDGATSG